MKTGRASLSRNRAESAALSDGSHRAVHRVALEGAYVLTFKLKILVTAYFDTK